jgi:hypothetical protein
MGCLFAVLCLFDDAFAFEDLADLVSTGLQVTMKANLLDAVDIGELLASLFKKNDSSLEAQAPLK